MCVGRGGREREHMQLRMCISICLFLKILMQLNVHTNIHIEEAKRNSFFMFESDY